MRSTALSLSFQITLLATLALPELHASTDSEEALWSYDGEYYPDKWSSLYPICGMQRQSPVNIDTSATVFDEKLDPLRLSYSDPTGTYISDDYNNGFTVNILQVSPIIRVTGGNLGSTFRVATVHFHWGQKEDDGSEHTINQKHYPLEMHVVCYDEIKYDTLSAAVQSPKGLAVIGRLFQLSSTDNSQLKLITDSIPEVREPNVHINLTGFDVSSLLPSSLDNYFRYDGSLTTPPCYETVTWTVLNDIGTVSLSQLNRFRSLREHHHANIPREEEVITFNWRPVQPLNQRSVYRSTENLVSEGKAVGNNAAIVVAAIARSIPFAALFSLIFLLQLLK